jgi:hypothetical protein
VIIFELRCKNGHKFYGWFKDRQAFDEQNSQHLVTCPVCNCPDVDIIPSSITIMGKDKSETKEISPAKAMQMLHQYIDKNFEDVGSRFAEVALKIHYGEEEKRNIRGTTTPQEEDNLKEERISFIKIPITKMDS